MSDTKLREKLTAIQTSLVANKDAFNSFGKYKYRSCESILEALKPHLKTNNVVLTLSDDVVAVADRVYIKATASISDGDTTVSTTAYAREALQKKGMDDSQITGAASSYARKYALCGLFAIDDNKDADATNDHAPQQQPVQQTQQQSAKPYYSDETLKANIAQWRVDLSGGKYNVGALLGTLSRQFTLTPQQVNTIRGLAPQQYQQ